jgi:hypothetical protein
LSVFGSLKRVGGKWRVGCDKNISEEEGRAAIQSVTSTWLRIEGDVKVFKGHVVRRSGGEKSFSDRVNREKR